MFKLKITRIQCYSQEDWTFDDDIRLSVGGAQVWRGEMNETDKSVVSVADDDGAYSFESDIQLAMEELDDLDGNDAIGGAKRVAAADTCGVECCLSFSGDDAVYNVWYTVTSECGDRDEGQDAECASDEAESAPCVCAAATVGSAVVTCPLCALRVVVATEEGRPLAGIQVAIAGGATRLYGRTDGEGLVEFGELQAGPYIVEVYWPNDVPQLWSHTLSLSTGESRALLARVVTGGDNPHPTGDEIIAIARSTPGGGGYDSSPPASEGAPAAVCHQGVCILGGPTENGTYCCACTFWAAMKALTRWGIIDDKSVDEIRTFKDQWYGRKGVDLRKPLLADALPNLGVGTQIAFDDAQPGDFCQLWRTTGTGHSVVFLGWKLADDGTKSGLRYWSSQTSGTNGIGEREEYFADSGVKGGTVKRSETFFARITPVSRIVVFEEYRSLHEYPAGEETGETE